MKSNMLTWLLVAAIVVVGGYWLMNRSTAPVMPESNTESSLVDTNTSLSMAEGVTVTLSEQNNLGQSGTAMFKENTEGKVVVTLSLTGDTFPSPQPAHIHLGACPSPGEVKYPLTNVVNGSSVTTLDVSWADLENSTTPLTLNVHKSSAESKVYTACGDLPVSGTTQTNDTDKSAY